jgi:RDD family
MTRIDRPPAWLDDGNLGDGDGDRVPVPVVRGPFPSPSNAGVVTRVLAACVDLAAVVLAAVGLDLAVAGVRFVWHPVTFRWPQPAVPVMGGAVLVVGVVYLTVAWAMTGRTYGERLLGLRVLSGRHALIGWTRAALRAVLCVVFPIGLLWSAFSSQRHSLQDIVVRTVVVYDTTPYGDPAGKRPRSGGH